MPSWSGVGACNHPIGATCLTSSGEMLMSQVGPSPGPGGEGQGKHKASLLGFSSQTAEAWRGHRHTNLPALGTLGLR